jgi:hypothetical protein
LWTDSVPGATCAKKIEIDSRLEPNLIFLERRAAVENQDPELRAMEVAAGCLEPLSPAARARVLRWLSDRFACGATPSAAPPREEARDLPTRFAACRPESEAERALVAAAWLQEVRGLPDLDAQRINRELKHLGVGIGNVTKALTRLMERRPQLVVQVHKAGRTPQARKRYRVTEAGLSQVRTLAQRAPT